MDRFGRVRGQVCFSILPCYYPSWTGWTGWTGFFSHIEKEFRCFESTTIIHKDSVCDAAPRYIELGELVQTVHLSI